MKGDRLRCRGCGRYRSVTVAVDLDDVFDHAGDDAVDVEPCPTDECGVDVATLAG